MKESKSTGFSIMHGKASKSAVEKTAQVIFTVCAFFAILAVFSITLYMIINGTPALFTVGIKEILFSTVWKPSAAEPSYGILYIILTSIVGTTLAILLGVPIGLMTAVFLAEVAPKRLASIVKPAIELLAGIPSVIYGLLGLMILNPLMYELEQIIFKDSKTHQFTGGANLISAVIVLAIMILPTVINISESAIQAVPKDYKAASLALGASHIQSIFRVILPAAKSGIVTAIVLGVGRAIGEAMAITLVSGSSVNAPFPFNSVRFLTTAIVSEMGYASGTHRQVLFTIGLVLFVFIMIINTALTRILKSGDLEEKERREAKKLARQRKKNPLLKEEEAPREETLAEALGKKLEQEGDDSSRDQIKVNVNAATEKPESDNEKLLKEEAAQETEEAREAKEADQT